MVCWKRVQEMSWGNIDRFVLAESLAERKAYCGWSREEIKYGNVLRGTEKDYVF